MSVAKPFRMTLEEFAVMERQDGVYYELIDGLVMMSPSPSREHQKIAGNLYFALRTNLKDTDCDVIYELDVEFGENVYRPDLMMFCNEEAQLPELVVEVLSPSTRHRDLRLKVWKYEELGVKEYWIVDPKVRTVTVHDFVHDTAEIYGMEDTVRSLVRTDISVVVADIFERL